MPLEDILSNLQNKDKSNLKKDKKISIFKPIWIKSIFVLIAGIFLLVSGWLIWLNFQPQPEFKKVDKLPATGEFISRSGTIDSITQVLQTFKLRTSNPNTHEEIIISFKTDKKTLIVNVPTEIGDIQVSQDSVKEKSKTLNLTDLGIGSNVTVYFVESENNKSPIAKIIAFEPIPVPVPFE